MIRHFWLMCLMVIKTVILFGQDLGEDNVELESDIIPYRPRIAEITFNNLYDYKISSTSDNMGEAETEIERDTQMKIRLGAPIIMKEKTMFGVQLKYDRHDFLLDYDNGGQDYGLYNHIERQKFTSLGGRFLLRRDLEENKNVTIIAGAELKSDRIKWTTKSAKYYLMGSYEVTLNKTTKIGGGLALAYTLSAPQIYPFLSYEHKINRSWTLDLYLPKTVALRYKVDSKFYITASAEVKGWRYAIRNAEVSTDVLTLRKSDLYTGVSLEHEIHDWLWVGFDMGYTFNLRNYLAEPGDRRRDALIELNPQNAPFARFGLFIVPPKKFYM
ncbi:DUF6268 family outer membrane beta-barrel protein [Fulvivirga sediminis]|uniref:DUF6268 domain-containing protein n=1 Tax=Fulvivirga sediminis TaxID=2803949 RepID=A0A937F459_9BACT|nr:DUF6268 family outer membrane beta-barrel protein [Fulvivirga sediminis]MBL3654547.1 hypothetical protein [Fulvivirga sediminis]